MQGLAVTAIGELAGDEGRSAKEISPREEFAEDGEGLALDVARGAEAGADAGQVGVVIAGMGDQLPCAGGYVASRERRVAASRVPVPAMANGAVGGGKSFFGYDAAANRFEPSQSADLEDADQGAPTVARRPRRLEGIADGADAAARAARSTGRSTAGNMWVCLWVSMWVRWRPRFWRCSIWARGFGLDFSRARMLAA